MTNKRRRNHITITCRHNSVIYVATYFDGTKEQLEEIERAMDYNCKDKNHICEKESEDGE